MRNVTSIEIGTRVDVRGRRGTVRYVGPVNGYQGEWIGIDWDDPETGKHDGSVNGKQYFKARSVTRI
ncbi:unnamed protein product [Gongylonema pulchrum]|uniref:CAP-Gly domain-containing protein n=1 Tax=Gongylonema pulchrum TaxID=637853 RepID=A0A183D844_9BILA|nr:unnamed protein product [Gongylonema pulchrum]